MAQPTAPDITVAPAPSSRGLQIAAGILATVAIALALGVGVLAVRASGAETTRTTVTRFGTPSTVPGADLGDLTSSIHGRPAPTSTAPTPATVPVDAPTDTPAPAPATEPNSDTPTTTAPATDPPTTEPPVAPAAPALTVNAPVTVSCRFGGTPYLTVSWTAPGATSVDLAIDGPGLYRSYPSDAGSDSVPFACGGPHTYTVTAHGPGGDATKVVTIHATTVLVPPTVLTPNFPIPHI